MTSNLPPVLVLGDHFGYAGGVAHGVTTYWLNVLPALRRRGVEVTACFLREPHPAADALREHGIEAIFFSAAKWNPLVAFQLTRLIRAKGCRVLHAAGIKASLIARLAARVVGAQTIIHVHDFVLPNPVVKAGHRLAARRSDLAICVSRPVQPVAVHGYHVDPGRVRVIHSGIRVERFAVRDSGVRSMVRQRENMGEEAFVIAMVARMYPVKGHRAMLRIMAKIAQSCPRALLMLVGDGPERAACEALTDALGIRDHVRFLGQRGDVPELLAAADVGVMSSESEGLPLAGLELLAAGCPLVTFDVGGMGDIVTDGVNGRLIAPGDIGAFAEAVVSLLQDPVLRQACAERARDTANAFSLDAHVERLIRCYEESALTGAVRLAPG